MALLSDYSWKTSYTSDDRSLVKCFYVPALECAVRYCRATGYFSARALTLASRGVEGLLRNDGRMRLLVGCTLKQDEVQAIEKGESLRDTVEGRLMRMPLIAEDAEQQQALELVSWMIAKGYLEVKVAVPCDAARRPCPAEGIFHDKSGIIEDKTGDRIAFSGSLNETPSGWGTQQRGGNWERLTVFKDFGEGNPYVDDVEQSLSMLWEDRAKHALVIDIPTAVHRDLLQFLPENDEIPGRLKHSGAATVIETEQVLEQPDSGPESPMIDIQKFAWGVIRHGSKLAGGERVGEATSIVTPWPHQIRSYERLLEKWPPKMLIADEVGLGKTITAGLLLRQAWISERAKRVLILAPKAVLRQWQVELREKFNMNWPIYDGHSLSWYKTPARTRTEEKVGRDAWHRQPFVIASSQLMRRADRAREILESDPWDMVVLDEAHHARRKGVGGQKDRGPNQLLRLMHGLRPRTQGLLLLTATPMQVHPVEVWDLLNLLGLPNGWDEHSFLAFFDRVSMGNPSHEDFEWLAARFREVEDAFGDTPREMASRCLGTGGKLSAMKILSALRDDAQTPRRQLSTERRRAAIKVMQANTPVARLVARHTRELLRRYFKTGKIKTPIPERDVVDKFVEMSPAERDLYDMVEDYISSTYNQASGAERNAVGFVMTIYRRRLASSFAALSRTLQDRFLALTSKKDTLDSSDEDVRDEDDADETMDADEAGELEKEALRYEEGTEIEHILGVVKRLPTDTKARELLTQLHSLRDQGHDQVMVFTQYTATLDFLREELLRQNITRVLCFSGRGGELPSRDGSWRVVSRDEVKRIFREKGADILLCTDAAAEGLNFQFCGALINYDLPWNPMKVEQRIGRIDRLGQKFKNIRIVNLHYENTVETDVYRALSERIELFTKFVGKLQPILASLPGSIEKATLTSKSSKEENLAALISDLRSKVDEMEKSGFDLDEVTVDELEDVQRLPSPYDLRDLDLLLRTPAALLPGIEVKPLAKGEYQYSMPGMKEPMRVTTRPEYFDEHPESTELWSQGSPLFPSPEVVCTEEEAREVGSLRAVFERNSAKK